MSPPPLSSPFQLPALILTIFPTYVEEHPLSKCICNAFLKFLFDEFTVPTAIRQDFPKWSRHIISNSFRIAAPDSIIHPSHEFVCEPPAAIASVQYMFQTAKEPGSGEICVALHVGAYDSLLFVEHPLYLPRWVDGYFQQLDLTSEFIAPHIGPILEDVQVEMLQSNLQETTGPEMAAQEEITNQASHQTLPPKKQSQTKVVKPARSVQALVTDSKAGKAEVGSRRSNTGKKLRCDIEGTSCLFFQNCVNFHD